jgi:hypothetical protein
MTGSDHGIFKTISRCAYEAWCDTSTPDAVKAHMQPAVFARLRNLDENGTFVLRRIDGWFLGDMPVVMDREMPANLISFRDTRREIGRLSVEEPPANDPEAAK